MRKKILTCLLSLGIVFCSGCGNAETVVNEYGFEVAKMGPYIEIGHEDGVIPTSWNTDPNIRFYSVYDKNTKIMYKITVNINNSYDRGITIMYDFDYDEEGYPILKFYDGGK